MIVQELREIQERVGWLPENELRELAARLGVPLHRLHEVASFYPLYRLQPPPDVDVKVCRDMACHINGAKDLQARLAAFGQELGGSRVVVGGVSCLGQCDRPVALSLNDHHIYRGLSEKEIREQMENALRRRPVLHQKGDRTAQGWKIDVYNHQPKYEAVHQFVKGQLTTEQLIEKLKVSTLRGLGGAGFPTWRKWDTVRGCKGDKKYIVCNADESEPGTFKDRELLRRTPWLVIEGMTLAALVTGADEGYIYLRHEYPDEAEAIQEALDEARDKFKVIGDNILGSGKKFKLELYMSPGGYVQGEESSLLEAIEDKRGEPRNKPPFPVFQGLFGKPTVINNVETLSWVPGILKNGGEWYRDCGVNGATGMRFVSISGDVNKPGVYETPFGFTVKELVMDLCGGMSGGQTLQAIAPSGPSGGFLPAVLRKQTMPPKFVEQYMKGADTYDILNLPLDGSVLMAAGSMLGAAFIVYGSNHNLVENALNLTEFFRNESCGKCVPCRTGSQKLVDMIGYIMEGEFARKGLTLPLISDLADTMIVASICGLGQVASNPITSIIRHFPEELDRYLKNGKQ